ncbi:proline dehydrogenase [Mobilicoccus caccae]|uniref:L-glutamate gamma-semialdehyde dehydrogenase n=1 Tax=Mobilicoccus caccae TaxID=1859295 RepID=A0ABQ6IXH2_9MICO|nr:bifunctional proline dehydrogenase/L-glutamate gamma-semialdehyde dehydrogenase [Mobilicoccus caccae]GMA41373.1 proline dehydrogenase [Mobilicoccus caccae]
MTDPRPQIQPDSTARDALAPFVDDAVALAHRWAEATQREQTSAERATTGQLASLVRDEEGLDFAVRFVDRVARPEDNKAAAHELSHLTPKKAASFLEGTDRALLGLGAKLAPLAPSLVVPLARLRLKQMVGHLVGDAKDPVLAKHLAAGRDQGFRLNVNLLGEAVLGEKEAASRTRRVTELLERPDVDYVSIKVSSLVSQISTWDHEGTVAHCLERLRPLYRVANTRSPKAFVNLDMEEYRDLDLTIELFRRMLSEPEFHDLEAGIVLQAYLPDALPALEELADFAKKRVAEGRAGIKVRLVKGANLAMEQVEAAVHGWEQAPYHSKEEVDANYLSCVERALREDVAAGHDGRPAALRVGVASHNLFDIAVAHLLAQHRGTSDSLDVEMLQGMAPSQSRAVMEAVGTVLLYTPIVAPEDFDVAVSYLIRRLEENSTPGNFLHAIFSDEESRQAEDPMAEQEQRFRDSVEAIPTTSIGPNRRAEREEFGDTFENTPDSDPSLPEVRRWALEALAASPAELTSPVLTSPEEVDDVVGRAAAAHEGWAARPAAERADILRRAGRGMEARRGEFITVMAAEGGKTVEQSDPEISEAIDFARYYADRALDLESGLDTDGARFVPDRVVLITPPWNFPVAIPLGGVMAALAAGSSVVIKPAHPTPGCVEVGVAALHEAGVPEDVLQVVRTGERSAGKALISHDDVETVVLTGASETARMFASWRLGHERGPRVYGETSGKNALIVTPAADLDLAVADLVKSAFGHAGQKCSAASLGILVGSVATSERFRRQLIDAVESLRVGWPQDISSTMGPIIEPAEDKLLRALTTLEPGESWIVEPRQLDDSGRLWSPGLKEGVRPGSFFHLTEVFGPVLGLMTASSLEEAIELQNATAFGLTGGLHSSTPTRSAPGSRRSRSATPTSTGTSPARSCVGRASVAGRRARSDRARRRAAPTTSPSSDAGSRTGRRPDWPRSKGRSVAGCARSWAWFRTARSARGCVLPRAATPRRGSRSSRSSVTSPPWWSRPTCSGTGRTRRCGCGRRPVRGWSNCCGWCSGRWPRAPICASAWTPTPAPTSSRSTAATPTPTKPCASSRCTSTGLSPTTTSSCGSSAATSPGVCAWSGTPRSCRPCARRRRAAR